MAATLTVLELPNLFVLLDLVDCSGDPEATIGLASALYSLLQWLGKPRLLERVGRVRDTAAAALSDTWTHAQFLGIDSRIDQQLSRGRLREALEGAQQLLDRAWAAGEEAYPGADYDLAIAHFTLARVLRTAGGPEQSLPLLDEARQRFEAITKEGPGEGADRMASVCIAERGDCLLGLGRLDQAAAAYEDSIRRGAQIEDARQVAYAKGQLGSVRLLQRRYSEALAAFAEARERFSQLDEPGSVAAFWHQTGILYQEVGEPERAEDAYRKSLAIWVRLGDARQASTLGQLGSLYHYVLNRPEEAVAFHRQAADQYVEMGDAANEGRVRSNLGDLLCSLRRFDEARREIRRAIECKEPSDQAGEPWTTWAILAEIETAAGNTAAAAEAKGKAIACYLAYRRDGGENHLPDGRIALAVTQPLLARNTAEPAALLERLAADPGAAWLLPFVQAIQAIVTGSRDRTLAEAPELDYTMASEILFLIDALEPQ